MDAVAAPVAALERRAAVRGSAQQKSDAYRCPRCVRDAERTGITIAPVQGARVSQRVFSLRDVITSASLRTRRGDTLVSLCESRFPLPRAVPAVCQLAACDAGLRRGDVGRAAKKMVGHGRAIVAVDKSQRQQPRGATLDYASELAALSAAAPRTPLGGQRFAVENLHAARPQGAPSS